MPFGMDERDLPPGRPVRHRPVLVPGVEAVLTEDMCWNEIDGLVRNARYLIYLDTTKKEYDQLPISKPGPAL